MQLSILPGIDCQVQTCGGAPFTGLLDIRNITGRNRRGRSGGASQRGQAARLPNRENLKIMGKTMLITLLLTTMAGLGAIKLRAVALENDPVKSFLSQFNGSSSMDHRGAPFEFMPPDRK